MDTGLPLVSDRVLVRPYEPGDVEFLHTLRNDPEVARYQTWTVPYPRDKAEALVADVVALGTVTPGEWCHFVAVDRATGTPVGDLPVNLHDSFPVAEIGYSFVRAWQGRGYATEAMELVVAWLFEHHHLRRLEAYLHPDNVASARLLERLGFLYEGTKRLSFGSDDDPSDDPVYGLLRDEWARWRARPRHGPTDVRLVDVTRENLERVLAVTIPRSQERSTPTVRDALIGAYVPTAMGTCRAVEADGEIVGLLLAPSTILVDRRHQGRGIEDRALALTSAPDLRP